MAKVLYACPSAHYSGHHPHVAVVEPITLSKAGHDVTLLTFCGIINEGKAGVAHLNVVKDNRIFRILRKPSLTRWFLMFFETLLTHMTAVRLYRSQGFDIIHVRDGEPFVFIPFLVSIPYRNIRWVISLTAAIIHAPKVTATSAWKAPLVALYVGAIHVIRSKWLWSPLYRLSMMRNQFRLTPQNKISADGYRIYMGRIFRHSVSIIPWGIDSNAVKVDKTAARDKLGLPRDARILLSFGAPHSGKNMDIVFQAVRNVEDAFFVHAGTHAFSLGSNTVKLAHEYDLNGRARIYNHFISEEDKPYFFGCADAMVLSYTKAFASESSMLWEASKYGVPVIASGSNLLGQDVRDYNLGIPFVADDAMSLEKAIRLFLSMSQDGLSEFEQGRTKFLEDHSEKLWAQRYSDVYEEMLC